MAVALALFAVVVGLLALLAIPVDVRLSVDCGEIWGGEARVRWLFGVVDLSKRTGSGKEDGERPAPRPAKRGRKRTGTGARRRRMLAALRSPGFVQRGLRFAADAARAVRIRSLRGSARIGLDDPADTGVLWGLLGSVCAGVGALPFAQIRIEPDFTAPTFVGQGTANLRVVPGRLMWTAGAFLISPVTLRAAWAATRR